MSPNEFTAALGALGWKQSDFFRSTGVTKRTPSSWVSSQTPIPGWVRHDVVLLLDPVNANTCKPSIYTL